MPPTAKPGPSSETVARNLARYRSQAELSQVEVAEKLTEKGVPLSAPSYSAIENGKVRVTVDLLVAAADVLGVSPASLLMPYTEDIEAEVELTGVETAAGVAWHWLTAQYSLAEMPPVAEDFEKHYASEIRSWRYRVSPIWWGRDGDR